MVEHVQNIAQSLSGHKRLTGLSLTFREKKKGGTWRPTLDFSSGHDLTVPRSSWALGSVLAAWRLLGIFSLSLSAPPLHALSLSLKINKH